MNKLPALQFYPGDWKKDPGIQALTLEQRAIWFECLLLMHEAPRRGFLMMNNKQIPDSALARMLGTTTSKVTSTLNLFRVLGICSVDETTGIIINRRMVRDEDRRQKYVSNGKQGGRSKANSNQNESEHVSKSEPNPNLNGGSSSSSSISSSTSVLKEKDKKEKSPILAGKEFFRMSEAEMVLAQEHYHRERLPQDLLHHAIEVVESWLAGDSPGGKKARAHQNHFRRLYAPWVLEQALVRSQTVAKANNETPLGSRLDFREKRLVREQQALEVVENFFADRDSRSAAVLGEKRIAGQSPKLLGGAE